jgi:hypothetical protein
MNSTSTFIPGFVAPRPIFSCPDDIYEEFENSIIETISKLMATKNKRLKQFDWVTWIRWEEEKFNSHEMSIHYSTPPTTRYCWELRLKYFKASHDKFLHKYSCHCAGKHGEINKINLDYKWDCSNWFMEATKKRLHA